MMDAADILEKLGTFADELNVAIEDDLHLRASSELRTAEGVERVLNPQAASLWEEQLKKDANDPAALHHLAIIHHGRAIERERADDRAWREIEGLYTRALSYWARLCGHGDFWEGVCALWDTLKETGQDSRATRFRADEWRGFRKRLPGLLLRPHVESARNALLAGDVDAARTHVNIIKNSGFDESDSGNARRSVYSTFKPNESQAVHDNAYEPAVDQIRQFLEADADFADALRDALSLMAKWVLYLSTSANSSDDEIGPIVSEGMSYAKRPSLVSLAKKDPMVAGDVEQFHYECGQHYLRKARPLVESHPERAIPWLDRVLDATKGGVPYDCTGRKCRQLFFNMLWETVFLRLKTSVRGTSPRVTKAAELVRMGLAIDPEEPGTLALQGWIAIKKGDCAAARDALSRARENATARSDSETLSVLGQLDVLLSQECP